MRGDIQKDRTFRDYLILGVKGYCMGAADVVPGVSGGTMAFILGIYRELIASIKSVDLRCLRLLLSGRVKEALDATSWKFLVSVAAGIFTAIFTIAKGLSYMLSTHPVVIWSFFFGLVAASAITICLEIEKWHPRVVVGMVAGTLAAYVVVGMVPASTPNTAWFLFLSGAFAICAMILPGISGAFILVLLGKYQFVLQAVTERDFLTLFIVAAGAATGLICFVRLLNWLFERYRHMTIALLAGLLVGSLRKIWPWKTSVESFGQHVSTHGTATAENVLPASFDGEFALAFALMILGAAAVILIEYLGRKMRRQTPRPQVASQIQTP